MPFTDEEHAAIVKATVDREVASAVEKAAQENERLKNSLDVVEGEKAGAIKRAEDAEAKATQLTEEQERAKAAAARRDERVASVRALSNFDDSYYTPERTLRWAEMADDAFEGLLNDMADGQVAVLGLSTEEAQRIQPLAGADRRAEVAKIVTARKEAASKGGGTPLPHETAAFRGGQPIGGTPTSGSGGGMTPALSKFRDGMLSRTS